MNQTKHLPLTLVAISIAFAYPTLAQTTDNTDTQSVEKVIVMGSKDSGYLSDKSKVASKLSLSIKETPQSISVISPAQLQDFAITDLNTALENAPGITVEQIETDRTYYRARGFDITNFQIDGLGLPAISGNLHGDMDTAMFEKIEIVRGANGLMTGMGNPSATVNMVRKKPTQDTQISANFQLGSWDNKRLDLDASGSLSDNVRGRVVVAAEDKESYLDRYSMNKQVYYGVIEADVTDNTLLTAGVSHQSSTADGNMWGALTLYYTDGTPTNFDRSTNSAADWSTWEVVQDRLFFTLEHTFSNNWQLGANYSHVDTDEDSLLFYTYGTLNAETGLGLTGYGSEYDRDDKQDLFDLYVNGEFSLFGRMHEVVAGVNWSRLQYQETSLYDYHTGNGFPAMPTMDNWDGDTPLPEFTDYKSGSDIDIFQRSAYLAGRFSITDELTFIAGARYNATSSNGASYGKDRTTDDSEVIPYAGLTYAFNSDVLAYASYTETYEVQTEQDANFNQLAPLTGEAKEIGVKTDLLDDKALLTVAYFDIKQVNLAVAANEQVTNPTTGVPETVYYGAEGISSKGVEIELTGEIAEGWQGTFAYTNIDLSGDDTVKGYTPEQLIRLSTTYRLPALEQLKVGASVSWQDDISRNQGTVGEGFDNAGETIVTHQDAYALINLMASFDVTSDITVSANINNLTDEKYLNSLYWAQGFYGAPRNYSVNLRWSY